MYSLTSMLVVQIINCCNQNTVDIFSSDAWDGFTGECCGTWERFDKRSIHASVCEVRIWIAFVINTWIYFSLFIWLLFINNAIYRLLTSLYSYRCSPRSPKLIRNSVVPRDPRKSKNPSLKSRSHSIGPCDSNRTDHLNYQTSEGFYRNHPSFRRVSSILEDDSSSDNSSSIFSEAGSCSTESSTRDSMSADDYFDQIFGDSAHNWNSSRGNTSDSDTSSSSSSPSPLYSKNTPYTSSDHYVTRYKEESH